jgi:hypothetical protein
VEGGNAIAMDMAVYRGIVLLLVLLQQCADLEASGAGRWIGGFARL